MVKVGDKISPLLKIDCSGKVIEVNSKTLKIHKGTPFFLTEGTKVYKKSGSFIKKEELLGTITFEQIVTGDIVQGLPKIEEILEARKPQNPALLSENPGIIKKIKNSKLEKISTIEILGNVITPNSDNPNPIQKSPITYTLNRKKTGKMIIVKKNDYIYVGQPLTEGSVNPHTLLITYFNYYKNFGNDYEAAYQSFKNVQLLLIQKVQQVYNSQGVDIADKHLEIIIKRITSKVQINKTGGSFLLPGELVELKQIQYINEVLDKSNQILATYQPILLGITKASLVTDSFISAASFQETTKILTSAAIEGKIDWLRGLKENVIIGRLIPVGTGFRPNINV
jgi:DNA-directed RNA polymerase subunit beta'